MAKTNGFTAKQFIKAIPGTGGIISTIAKRVGCEWHTAKKYIGEFPTVKQAYENEKHRIDDAAVSNIYKAITDGDLGTSKWWASMKMGDEFHPTEEQKHSFSMDDWKSSRQSRIDNVDNMDGSQDT